MPYQVTAFSQVTRAKGHLFIIREANVSVGFLTSIALPSVEASLKEWWMETPTPQG